MLNCLSSLFMICIVFCILQYSLNMRIANEASIQIEDGLAASCLAGLYIDTEKYTDTFVTGKADVVVESGDISYELFCKTLKNNLDLDNNKLLQNVRINKYVVYNVSYNRAFETDESRKADIYYYGNEGLISEEHRNCDDIYSPNGIRITNTSVYADVLFDLKLMNGKSVACHRQLLTQAYKR